MLIYRTDDLNLDLNVIFASGGARRWPKSRFSCSPPLKLPVS